MVDREAAQLHAYAAAQGVAITRMTTDKAELQALYPSLQRGDVLLVPDLLSITESPSKQAAGVLDLLTRGIDFQVLSLRGSIAPHLLALQEVWKASQAIEDRLSAALEREKTREASIAAEQAAFETEAMANMARLFGVSHLLAQFKTVTEPEPAEPLADIKTLRTERSLTQDQAAELCGVNRSQFQRAEEGRAPPELITQVQHALSVAAPQS
jgi:DNA-binding XRE family transcriptional regulator